VAGQGTVAGVVPAKVAALTGGVLKSMMLTKFKGVLVWFVVAALSAAAGLMYQTQAVVQSRGQTGLPECPKPPSTPQTPATKKKGEDEVGGIKPAAGPADYKAIFVKTLGVVAEHFETINYANQFDGRIEARSQVTCDGPLRIFRLAEVTIQPCDDGGFAIQIRINILTEANPKSTIVGRDADLERVLLQRLNISNPMAKEKKGDKSDKP
jgi:hypothetical protein